jgi:hypothetical protein
LTRDIGKFNNSTTTPNHQRQDGFRKEARSYREKAHEALSPPSI